MQDFIIFLTLLLFGGSLVFFILSFFKKFNSFKWPSILGMFITSILFFVLIANYTYEARTSDSLQTSEISSAEESDISSSEETSTSETSYSSSSEQTFNPNDYEVPDFGAWNHDQLEQSKKVQITGKVLQNMKRDSSYYLRVAMDDDYDKVVMIEISSYIYKDVIAENDNVTFYGLAKGLTSYESTLGKEITLPLMIAQHYTVNNYGN
ncbi:hypothetical protein HMPREF2730_04175 [Streptococcus sp. HMSC034F02]|jgi:hypothetical protein|uniref:TcdA-E operon negative regulator n=2 Tax=root TaxID=1 RepID=W1TSA9_STRAP|nr:MULTISPECIES: hypothetical protein [Streptococcus]ETI84522.1 MAG: hypothetical protein Q615_SPAC00127G0166 [Streptococcus anginosus DORA_7]QBX31735.1 hypothetical protein Javan68_0045 [Streptococcus phage Javan68]KAA9305163.1 hypothetical protein F6I02_03940 [Streptococcus anginosus]KAA9320480.1 hypothetical protein F6H95_10765 [Streptococcus anginosus]MDB8648152.1 hypothetical protein [Streptococcus anginosus]